MPCSPVPSSRVGPGPKPRPSSSPRTAPRQGRRRASRAPTEPRAHLAARPCRASSTLKETNRAFHPPGAGTTQAVGLDRHRHRRLPRLRAERLDEPRQIGQQALIDAACEVTESPRAWPATSVSPTLDRASRRPWMHRALVSARARRAFTARATSCPLALRRARSASSSSPGHLAPTRCVGESRGAPPISRTFRSSKNPARATKVAHHFLAVFAGDIGSTRGHVDPQRPSTLRGCATTAMPAEMSQFPRSALLDRDPDSASASARHRLASSRRTVPVFADSDQDTWADAPRRSGPDPAVLPCGQYVRRPSTSSTDRWPNAASTS